MVNERCACGLERHQTCALGDACLRNRKHQIGTLSLKPWKGQDPLGLPHVEIADSVTDKLRRDLADAKRENELLRIMLAANLAGPLLYVDDGELSDTSELPFIDYKRDSAEGIADALKKRALARLKRR